MDKGERGKPPPLQVGTTPYDPLYLKSIQTQRNLFSQEQTGPQKIFPRIWNDRRKNISQNLRKLFWPLTRVIMGRSSFFFDVLKSPGPPLSFKHNFYQAIPNISPRLSENTSAVTPNKFIFPESGTNRSGK